MVIISGVKIFQFIPKVFKSLQLRIIGCLSLLSLFSVFFLSGAILESYEQRVVAVRTAEIQNQCTILCNQLFNSNYLSNTDSEVINAELSQLSNIYNGRVVVIDDSFRIVKDTYNLQEGKTIVSEDVIRCFRGEQISHYDDEACYIEVTAPVIDPETKDVLGIILLSTSADTIRNNRLVFEEKVYMSALTIWVIAVILSIFVGTLLVSPLKKMTVKIQDLSEGHGENQLVEKTYYETERMAEAFNRVWEHYQALDASRDEFVANVSHELKTPLTSMKVLADSLIAQPGAPVELYEEFMQDLSEEIERENKIINDLLALVKLDKKGANLNIQSQNINDLVERILKRLQPLAANRNIEVVYESFRPVTAEVDEVKFSLLITNLVENAIKYNHDEGWVHVSLNADHKYFYVKVEDSGIGIPKEDQNNIFERFYRVDKSHSREIGGTGLGLAIARNAAIMHRGAIKVHSVPMEGTTFTVRIPLTYIRER